MQSHYIAFNVPLTTFLHQAGPARALEICGIAAHPADRVLIELVETSTPPDLQAVGRAAEAWRRVGFRIVIDDAGPRLPHWRDLLALPFNGVKLDGCLAPPGAEAMRHAEAIVAAAKLQGKFVIAEGIEDRQAADRMRGLGVDAMQGYFFCRPVPVPALRLWAGAWESLLGARSAA
jgi:EAL domain-containing protein (putative c-di-GMP-specific phosphodiesterase class I)